MKKGIELSVNFIVVFIIALVIFFFGINFIYNIIHMGEEQEIILSQHVEEELERLALQGERLSIAFNRETIPPGKQHLFGLGIVNIDATKTNFAIGVEPGPAYDIDNSPIENNIKALYNNKVTIELDKHKKIGIMVKTPRDAKSGSYILNVFVCNSEDKIDECTEDNKKDFYDKDNPVRKIYVEVP